MGENTVSAQDPQVYEPGQLIQVLQYPCPVNYTRMSKNDTIIQNYRFRMTGDIFLGKNDWRNFFFEG